MNRLLFIYILLFFSSPTFSEEAEKLTQEETLKRLIETELISEKYEACVEAKDPAPWDCVWNQLNPDEKKQVSEILGEFTDSDKKDDGTKYEGKAIGGGLFHDKASPVMKQLGDNLFDMFQEAMYGEITAQIQDTELRLVDHRVFYDIYKARISKEFIELLASFCLDSSFVNNVYEVPSDEQKLKDLREQNIKNMHQNPEGEKTKFNTCIVEIKNICTHQANGGSCTKINGKNIACAKDDHTQDRACQVQEAVNSIKKSIAATDVIQKALDEDAAKEKGQGSLGSAISGKKVSIYTGAKMGDRQSVDTMTSITSGQLEEAMKAPDDKTIFEEAAQKLKDDCQQSLTEECKEYVLDGDEIKESKDKIAELAIRMRAMEERISQNLDPQGGDKSKKELEQFFKEEGLSEEEIEKIVTDDKKVKLALEQIKNNYRERREAIINNLQNKLSKMVPQDDTDEEKIKVISRVSEELMDRPKQYQQLLHYSNIVSSYLSTSSPDADTGGDDSGDNSNNKNLQVSDQNNSSRYTTAAAKELGSLGEDYQDVGDDLAKKVDIEADSDPDNGEESLISIGLDTINNFLYKEVLE